MVVFSFFSAFFCFFVDIQSFLWLFSCNESFSRKSHCILYLNWFKIVHRRKIAVQHNKQKMKNNLKFSPSPLFCNRFEFKSWVRRYWNQSEQQKTVKSKMHWNNKVNTRQSFDAIVFPEIFPTKRHNRIKFCVSFIFSFCDFNFFGKCHKKL